MPQLKHNALTCKFDIFSDLNRKLGLVFRYVPMHLKLFGLKQFPIICLECNFYISYNIRAGRYDSFIREAN